MKRFFVFVASFLLLFCLFSCSSKDVPNVLGKWESEVTLKSDLAGNEGDSIVAHLYTKQKTVLSFAENGIFSKSVEQRVERIEFVDASENQEDAKAYFSQYFNKNLVFEGEYIQKKQFFSFSVLAVKENNGEVMPYADFFARDPSIGDDEYSLSYRTEGDMLVIDGIAFKKVE